MYYNNVVTGAWIQAVGAIIAAIGETIEVAEANLSIGVDGLRLVSIGNGLEGVGNAIQAIGDTQEAKGGIEDTPLIYGSWLQVVGNFTNSVAAEIELMGEEIEGIKLDIIGDSTQSIGAAFEAYGANLRNEEYDQDIAKGNVLISLGAAFESIGEVFVLKGNQSLGSNIQAFGSYAEVAGATIAAIAHTKQYEKQSNKNWKLPYCRSYYNRF